MRFVGATAVSFACGEGSEVLQEAGRCCVRVKGGSKGCGSAPRAAKLRNRDGMEGTKLKFS